MTNSSTNGRPPITLQHGEIIVLPGLEPETGADEYIVCRSDSDEGGWILYTMNEWVYGVEADLTATVDGSILFQGEPTGFSLQQARPTGQFAGLDWDNE